MADNVFNAMPNEGTCKLCLMKRKLCRSHIVPQFIYGSMKDERDHFYELGSKVRRRQNGYFERLLCSSCERIISGYESVFKQVWMDTVPERIDHGGRYVEIQVPDYSRFKLFHLSVLWRASISSHFKIHPQIGLGPLERKIATLLLSGGPVEPGEFPIIGSLNLDEDQRPVGTVTQLAKGLGRYKTHHYYMMSYAFCDWMFIVTQNAPDWLTRFERRCINNHVVIVQTTPFAEAKSVQLSIDMLRAVNADLNVET